MFFRWYYELRSDGPLVVLSFCTLVLLSFHPSVRKSSWDWLISFFLKLSMVLEVYVLLCVPEPDFFCPKNGENDPKIGFLGFIGKFSHFFFLNLVYKKSSYYLLYSSTNPILGKKSCSWYMSQNALGQSDCRIFKLTISPEQKDEKDWEKSLMKNPEVGSKISKWAWSKMGLTTLAQGH